MNESDTRKSCLGGCLAGSSFVIPPIGLIAIWAYTGEFGKGAMAGFILFVVLFVAAGGVFTSLKEPSALLVWAPFSAGMIYTVLPDAFPVPFDDAGAVAAGSIATFALWLKRQPDVSFSAVLPLLFASVYTLVGVFVPGPVDELLVGGLSMGTSLLIARSRPSLPPKEDSLGS